jgi:hypothetical protein
MALLKAIGWHRPCDKGLQRCHELRLFFNLLSTWSALMLNRRDNLKALAAAAALGQLDL